MMHGDSCFAPSTRCGEGCKRARQGSFRAQVARADQGSRHNEETIVRTENWHQERDRLLVLLQCMESAKAAQASKNEWRSLQASWLEDIPVLKKRLAQLNDRLGDTDS